MDKTLTVALIVEEFLAKGLHVDYLDLDFQFSSIASIYKNLDGDSSRLSIFHCGARELLDSVIEMTNTEGGLSNRSILVVDSINTMQLLLREQDYKTDSLKANHEAGILLTLLQDYVARNDGLLLITNIIRSRPRETEGSKLWEQELAGGRLIRSKSEAIFRVSRGRKNPAEEGNHVLAVERISRQSAETFVEEISNFSLRVRSFTLR